MAIDVKTIERGALHEAKEFFWVFLSPFGQSVPNLKPVGRLGYQLAFPR